MKITVPSKVSDLRIRHLKAFDLLSKEQDIRTKIKLVALCTDQKAEDIAQVTVKDINKIYNQLMRVLNQYKQTSLPLILTIEGQEFELVQDFTKLPSGWFMDSDGVDFEKFPELLPAFCYIEKGMDYAEKDKHKNVLNPLSGRSEIFKKHLPLTTFLDLAGFFLLKQNLLNRLSMEKAPAKTEI